ncbi:hypothetical protein HJFPF1_05401 [Paramyrothecium foliicola]|nr:hypothetical protein HJFPF1_05401 [Paramyrothecium foliicola]
MGIPHLISTLEPFATLSPLAGQEVVIDGPALAYHVLNVCRGNGLHYPSPDVLGSTAVRWLEELTSRSVVIKAIYFDGFLPQSKEPVRMERMARNTAQLKHFFSNNQRGCPLQYFSNDSDASALNLFNLGRLSGKPPVTPTFLVPAVTDVLHKHPLYQEMVQLVPAEADAYCAKHLAEHGGIVLTSDSDLLAHDLGSGMVAFFRDVHLDAEGQLVSATFDPSQICTRLGLKPTDACRLAYERQRRPHHSLPQLVQSCLKAPDSEAKYHNFCQQYLSHETATPPTSLHGGRLNLGQLDPRVSELILRLGQDQQSDGKGNTELRMFLPVLLETPARGSAWEPSTFIRVLAYTIARWIIPGPQSVVLEFRRVQNLEQKGRQLSILPKATAGSALAKLLQTVTLLKSLSGRKQTPFWLFLFIVLDIQDRQEADKDCFLLRMVQAPPGSFQPKRRYVSWDHVHLLAHLQAMWYSLRILKQVLILVSADSTNILGADARQLLHLLAELPLTTNSPDLLQVLAWLDAADQSKTMNFLARFVNIPAPPVDSAGRRASKGQKQRIRAESSSHMSGSSSPSNKFSLLTTD